MTKFISRLGVPRGWSRLTRGASATEYALVVGLLAITMIFTIGQIGGAVGGFFNSVGDLLTGDDAMAQDITASCGAGEVLTGLVDSAPVCAPVADLLNDSTLPDPDTLARRETDGSLQVAVPVEPVDAATKQYVDDQTLATVPQGERQTLAALNGDSLSPQPAAGVTCDFGDGDRLAVDANSGASLICDSGSSQWAAFGDELGDGQLATLAKLNDASAGGQTASAGALCDFDAGDRMAVTPGGTPLFCDDGNNSWTLVASNITAGQAATLSALNIDHPSGDAASAPDGNTLALRETDGSLRVNAPSDGDDAATKDYVDAQSGGSSGTYQLECLTGSNDGRCLRLNTATGSVDCKFSSNLFNPWIDCSDPWQ